MSADEIARGLVAMLPKHAAGLTIERNPGRVAYESVAQWLISATAYSGEPSWSSPEARVRAIETDDVWVMQWYPATPVGFHLIAAPTLGELLVFAAREAQGDDAD